MNERKWYLRTQDETFGPETEDTLVSWAKLGRIQPGQEVTDDNVIWTKAEEVPFLDMRFSIDLGDGNPRGPFNRAAAEALVASGRLPVAARVVEIRPPFPGPSVAAEPVGPTDGAAIAEDADGAPPPSDPEVKVVEVPVEKIVEKVVTVVDETRVKELEGMLAEERSRVASLQSRFDESSKSASEQRNEIARLEGELKNASGRERALEERLGEATAKFEQSARDAVDREMKLNEQIAALEDELRRLPQAASEVADIQAAMFGLMTREAEELEAVLAAEKTEAEEFRKRFESRSDRLLERRRELLKRAGANIEEMTRKSLIARPEDPRTAQLRRELDDLRRADEKKLLDAAARIRELESAAREKEAESRRSAEGLADMTELRRENSELRERLQARERELLSERERSAALRQREAENQQAMVARLKALESPTIGISSAVQHREAKAVRIPGWMRIGVGK